jgi:hypothetical protein
MAKISHHFRLGSARAEELTKLAEHYSVKYSLSTGLTKNINKTDIIEMLIADRFAELLMKEEIESI